MVELVSLDKYYQTVVVDKLKEQLKISSVMAVPRIAKVTLNMGLGEAAKDKKVIEPALADMSLIAGQKAVVTYARISEAGFKIREGWPIGCKVTIRKQAMYHFLTRLVHVVLPRVRDFHGFNFRSFDRQGNFNFGLSEQIVFPEIHYDKIDVMRGLDVAITIKAHSRQQAILLMTMMKFPFRDKLIGEVG